VLAEILKALKMMVSKSLTALKIDISQFQNIHSHQFQNTDTQKNSVALNIEWMDK
jgi:hypothetical protein